MSQHHTQGRQGRYPRRPYRKGGKSSYGNDRNNYKSRKRQPQPKKLTFWQKVLKFLGLYKPAVKQAATKAPKQNIRVAKSKNPARGGTNAGPKQPVSSSRLYVGNLSYEATESDLEDLFKGIGAAKSVEILYNPRTHKSKGYAFIEMQSLDDAKRAVEILHNRPFMGRNLLVSGANEKQEQAPVESKPAGQRKEENISVEKEESSPLLG